MGEGPDSSYRAVRNFPWHGGVPAGPAARLKLRRITRTCHILSWAARTVLAAICAQRPERSAGVCLGQAVESGGVAGHGGQRNPACRRSGRQRGGRKRHFLTRDLRHIA